jgi:hypothetical protein
MYEYGESVVEPLSMMTTDIGIILVKLHRGVYYL